MSFFKNPSFWFTLISSSAALYTVIYNYVISHKKPVIYVECIHDLINSGGQINMIFFINNPSNRAISLTKIQLPHQSKLFNVTTYPVKVVGTVYSDSLPININPYQSEKFLVSLQYIDEAIFDNSKVKIWFTINQKILRKKFLISEKLIDTEQLLLILDQQLQQSR